jgi:hypothetical protein
VNHFKSVKEFELGIFVDADKPEHKEYYEAHEYWKMSK